MSKESRTLDAWEYISLPRVLRNVATAGVALAISCPALYSRSNLSIPQLALTIVGAAALAPRLGAFVASKAANFFRKSFKPACVAKEIQKVAELSKSNSKSVLYCNPRRIPHGTVYASSDKVEEYNIEYKDDMTPRFLVISQIGASIRLEKIQPESIEVERVYEPAM